MALSTTPAPPVTDMIGQSLSFTRSLASYAGGDMRWMVYHGAADFYFDRNTTLNVVNDVFRALDIEETMKIQHVDCDMSHEVTEKEMQMMVQFINGKNSDDSQEYCPWSFDSLYLTIKVLNWMTEIYWVIYNLFFNCDRRSCI